MNEQKKQLKHDVSRRRHNFLIDAFFKGIDGYAINESVDGWVLVKHINGDTGDYEVAIFTKEAYQKSQQGYEKYGLFSKPTS